MRLALAKSFFDEYRSCGIDDSDCSGLHLNRGWRNS